MNENDVKSLGQKLSNWGRWGAEDELGTVNFITPEKIADSGKLIRKGRVFSLSLPFDNQGPQSGLRGRVNPIHLMTTTGADAMVGISKWLGSFRACDDYIIMPLQCATHWDSLAHVFYDGQMWNGHSASSVSAMHGAQKNSIAKLKNHIVSRGILLDIPRYKDIPELEPSYAITVDDLEGAAAKAGVSPETGDVLIVRTGFMTKFFLSKNWEGYVSGPCPGLALETAPWLREKHVAAVASDNIGIEILPSQVSDTWAPWHMVVLRDMGMTLGEMFYLDELAEDCAADGVYEFQFVGQPLPFTNAVGSPVNPLAIK